MKIKPFRGIRPPKELVEQVSSRPYDVLNSDEARQEAAGNEMSLYHIIKPEINFAPGTDEHAPRVSGRALLCVCTDDERAHPIRPCGRSMGR